MNSNQNNNPDLNKDINRDNNQDDNSDNTKDITQDNMQQSNPDTIHNADLEINQGNLQDNIQNNFQNKKLDNEQNRMKGDIPEDIPDNIPDNIQDNVDDDIQDNFLNNASDKAHVDFKDDVVEGKDDIQEINLDLKQDMKKIKLNKKVYKIIRFIFTIGFVVCLALFINEVFIQPYRTQKVINQINDLYSKPSPTPFITPTPLPNSDDVQKNEQEEVVQDPNRDDQGRLLHFSKLLEINEDVKGWLSIPDSNIDYVVLQSGKEDPEFYLSKNIYKEYDKAGSLFLDSRSSVENNTKNLVIHGHNMKSTDNMFHYLLSYNSLDYYKERPVVGFDSIFETDQWKIISVLITNGSNKKEPLFDYTRSTFRDASDFLNFVYEIRVRSILNIDTVDVNENDQLLTLSTCSYELDDYRTAIIARKVREGEDPTVDVDSVTRNSKPLYPASWYKNYGGTAPETTSFEEALEAGQITWYTPVNDTDDINDTNNTNKTN